MELAGQKVKRTRFKELGFCRICENTWQHVDITDPKHLAQVGPQYKTQMELLADTGNYARFFGCENA